MQKDITTKTRIYGLDLVKAISIILVLIWHLRPIDISIPDVTRFHINILFKEAQIALYFQITLIAVPALLVVSLLLFFRNFEDGGWAYTLKRLQLLFAITVFWMVFQSAFLYFAGDPSSASAWLPSSGLGWMEFFLRGGPSLEDVSTSPFYFLSTLFVLTALAALFATISKHRWFGHAIGLGVIAISLLYFESQEIQGKPIAFFDLKNFFLYVPIAYYLHKSGTNVKWILISILWAGYLLFCAQDIYFRHAGIPFNIYGRVSLVFGSIALICTFLNVRTVDKAGVVTFLSRHSLGIFALHWFFQYILIILLEPLFIALEIRRKMPMGVLRVNFQVLATSALSAFITVTSVYFLGKTALKRFFVS